jgi:FMN phosphatase YigB (HAD superfamily)
MKKTLLLDFDGVLLRDPLATKLVSNRATRYVQKFTKANIRDAAIINKYLYKSFGHTVTGLNKIGYPATMEDYNKTVYHHIDYTLVASRMDTGAIYELLDQCHRYGIKVMLFTNSPPCWHENIMARIPLPYEIEKVNMLGLLKPDPKLYIDIEKKHRDQKLYFVDDSFTNFASYTLFKPNWINIMYDEKNMKIRDNLVVINKIPDILDAVMRQ